MPLAERITSVDKLRTWTDQIPFHYEYTAGVAGERFLRGVQQGKLLASTCPKCGKSYVPPKAYCVDCFVRIEKYKEIGASGTVAAVAESYVDFEGGKLEKPRTFVFVTFEGAVGGLVQAASGRGIRVGDKVSAEFRPASKREGSMRDFQFVKVRA